ncbi:MAG: hypothetical protein ACRCUE_16725 [Bosea sp. (in: a-proteobacteria)]
MKIAFCIPSVLGTARLMPVLGACLLLSGCAAGLSDIVSPSGPTTPEGGSSLANIMRFGTASLPPVPAPVEEEIECPPASIAPGGAALRIGAGASSEGVRSQITITDVVRECARSADGGVIMKVGADGRVLVGPAGSPGSLGATLRIEVRKGEQVLSSRNARVSATVLSGQAQAAWVHVEQGIVVPGSAFRTSGDIDVFVTLNPPGAGQTARRRR